MKHETLSFIQLLKENQNIAHKICRIYTTNVDDHNDLFQEIVIQVWKSYPRFEAKSKFSTWMYRIALNTAITLHRKKKSIITQEMNDYLFSIKECTEKEELDDKIKDLYKAIHQLSDIDKAMILMYLDEKTYEEISENLGITQNNARIKMMRAKDKLKNILNP